MGAIAAIIGAIGGLSAVIGIVTALDIIPLIEAQLTWTFWFILSAILLLASIAFILARGGSYD